MTTPARAATLLLLVFLLTVGAPHSRATPTSDALDFRAAMAAYERNHWPEAYATLSALADSGHPEAARLALQMRQFGPALYGREFVASAGQMAQWKRIWGCGGDIAVAGCQQALAAP